MMTGSVMRAALVLTAVTLVAVRTGVAQSRWVADAVQVGVDSSEREHDYAAEGATAGVSGGRPFRTAAGWLQYRMRVYDDTPVTVVGVVPPGQGASRTVELVVDHVAVTTRIVGPTGAAEVEVEFAVPFRITQGKNRVTILLRGVVGPTPAFSELRTVQEHLE